MQGTILGPKLADPTYLQSSFAPFIFILYLEYSLKPDPVTLIRIKALFALYEHVC